MRGTCWRRSFDGRKKNILGQVIRVVRLNQRMGEAMDPLRVLEQFRRINRWGALIHAAFKLPADCRVLADFSIQTSFLAQNGQTGGCLGGAAVKTERDQERLAALYEKFGPVIFARCRKILGDDAAAEDSTHETFLRVHRHLESTPREALAWIYRIATNYCLNELRDRSRRAEPRRDLPEVVGANLEAALADRDLAARLIGRAGPKVAAVAWLRYVDGMDQQEVADVLGLSRRTVVNHLSIFNRNALKFIRRAGG